MVTHSSPSSSSSGCRVERGVHGALMKAAAVADEHATSALLQLATDADLNTADDAGRTLLGTAIAGTSWQDADASDASFRLAQRLSVLGMLLRREPGLSLYSLNAPQDAMQGVTPLGLAAWLNVPEAVRLLLEVRPGTVCVDGVDSRGATPLMYAARDGNVEVVLSLLAHGARPDYRDIHHRTAICHALRQPQVLWLCESFLRRQRAHETITKGNKKQLCHLYPELDESLAAVQTITCHPHFSPMPPMQELLSRTALLVSAVSTQDIHELDYLLFSPDHALVSSPSPSPSSSSASTLPFLVNYPDEKGWSPIHHCVSAPNPSSTVLDMLYRAGADVSLYTLSGHGTPLHCLAHRARAPSPSSSSSIRSFIHHLVYDLRAPLSARDRDGETCIHVAAEHGHSVEVLDALLDCDTVGAVRNMRNSRGLTALEVAQPRFRIAFGVSSEPRRAGSSASVRTIKPSTSSMDSSSSLPIADLRIPSSSSEGGVDETLALFILDNLHFLSREFVDTAGSLDVQAAEDLLQQTSGMGDRLLSQVRRRFEDVVEEVVSARRKYQQMVVAVENATRAHAGDAPEPASPTGSRRDGERRLTMNTYSSEGTMVSNPGSESGSMVFVAKEVKTVDVAVLAVPLPTVSVENEDDDDPFADPYSTTSPSTPARPDFVHRSLRPVKSMTDIRQTATAGDDRGFLGLMSPWVKGLPRKRSKSDLTNNRSPSRWAGQATLEESLKSSTARLRAWFKRKISHEGNTKTVIVMAIDEEGCPVGREVKSVSAADMPEYRNSSEALSLRKPGECVSYVLATAGRDLDGIRGRIESAERYVDLASRSIQQAGQLLHTMVQDRQETLEAARFIQEHLADDVERASPPELAPSLRRKHSEEFLPVTIPSSPRHSQLVFPRPPVSASSASSLISFSSSVAPASETDDTWRLRRLLTWKIQTRLEGACDEIEKAATWLRIVRDVTRPVRRRTEQ